MVIIIVLNLIFGVIIDTFADLRSEKQKKEEILKTTCFICGKCRTTVKNKGVTLSKAEAAANSQEMGGLNCWLCLPCAPQLVDVPGCHVRRSLAAGRDGEWMLRVPFFS